MSDFSEVKDPNVINIRLPCLRARQPVGDLFVSAMPVNVITKIAYFDVRRVVNSERDVERYLGIQRPVEPKRLRSLEEYVNYYDATFPSAIIIAVDERYASYDERTSHLTLSNVGKGEDEPSINISNLARVIDGQHRIAGLFKFKGDRFDVPVTIFVGADLADQAHIFSTVNLEQTKVNRSLVYDLYALAKSRSPQNTCHNIAVALDKDESSPFYRRIKRLGVTTIAGRFEPIAQAQFVEMLMVYISPDPKGDRDAILKGSKLDRIGGDAVWRYPFRNLFIDGKDVKIGEAIYSFFAAVRDTWPDAWGNTDREGLILNRTNGFRALMRLYGYLYRLQKVPGGSISQDFVRTHLKGLDLSDEVFNTTNFPPGSSGEGRLYRVLAGEETL